MTTAFNAWPRAAWATMAGVVILLLAYYTTSASTLAIWSRSETFAHGFLIFPISAFLIWSKRKQIARLAPSPDWRGVVILALLGLGWLAADLARVLVVQQLMLVGMIPALVFTLLGWRVAWSMSFPLAFLLLAVPMGEALIPYMMDFTADFTVAALQMTGIPVYREGTFFTIPSGNWSVVEECSGLRYLIASFTLGTLYGYLTYRSWKKRLLFALASVVVPIIANGMRAYMIVMIAHLSDMQLAMGVDHYIYGWVFFGIVMLLLFWVGSFWREEEEPAEETPGKHAVPENAGQHSGRMLPVLLAALAVLGFWPAYSAYQQSQAPRDFQIRLALPKAHAGWQAVEPFTDWRADYKGEDAQLTQAYTKNGRTVAVTLFYYRYQRRGADLVTSGNMIVHQGHPVWNNVGEELRSEQVNGKQADTLQIKLRSPSQRVLVWRWNWLNGRISVNDYWAKWHEAGSRLLGRWDAAAAIIISAPYDEEEDEAASAMREFMREMMPAIMASLDEAAVK